VNRLAGKVALVTGAAQGIGTGIAAAYAREGAKVALLDVDEASTHTAAQDIEQAGGETLAVVADVSDENAVNRAVQDVSERFGTIDILVNNAAVMPAGRLHETSPEDVERCLAVNIRGVYLLSRAVIPAMLKKRSGVILHMSSVTGLLGLPGIAIYSATKGALAALARAMSTDYAAQGIRVNAIAPGTIDSPMLHNFLAAQKNPEPLRDAFDAMHPIGRVGTINEVAQVCVFLASDEASFVTGATYTVDGGLSVKGEQPQDD
jgi:NAD(P)-dependent dehydrogenase (short-subunit alcohol dehydrogenase family)